jgi:hypothetical protein
MMCMPKSVSSTRLQQTISAFVLFGIFVFAPQPALNAAGPAKYDSFAKCLSEKKAVMYGAFWCENCKKQKDLFGESVQYIPYQECAVFGSPRQQTEQCKNLQIRKYPTWIFSDNERREGLQTLESLRDKTGCKLP